MYAWIFLQSCRTVGVDIQCGYVGGYPPYGTGPGGFPVPGGTATDGADPVVEARREVGVHLGVDVKSRGGV